MSATVALGVVWLLIGGAAVFFAVWGYRTTRKPVEADPYAVFSPHANAWVLVVAATLLTFVAIPVGLFHLLTGL